MMISTQFQWSIKTIIYNFQEGINLRCGILFRVYLVSLYSISRYLEFTKYCYTRNVRWDPGDLRRHIN